MTNISTIEPASFIRGDSVTWEISNSDYPASGGWDLQYTLINTTNKITITSTADGDSHLINLAPATTGAYAAGIYDWQAAFINTGLNQRKVVASDKMEVIPDYANAGATLDTRSVVKKTLDNINLAIQGLAANTVKSYTIGTRSYTSFDLKDLYYLQSTYESKYNAELSKANGNGKRQNKILVKL